MTCPAVAVNDISIFLSFQTAEDGKMANLFKEYTTKVLEKLATGIKKIDPAVQKLRPAAEKCADFIFRRFRKFLDTSPREKQLILQNGLTENMRKVTGIAVIIQFIAAFFAFWAFPVWEIVLFAAELAALYFCLRGYRAAYIILGGTALLNFLVMLAAGPLYVWPAVLGWLLLTAATIWGFKYENALYEIERKAGAKPLKRDVWRDAAGASVLAAVVLASCLFAPAQVPSPEERKAEQKYNHQLSMAAGTVVRHVYGYADFCHGEGYDMQKYPAEFKKRFEPEINLLEKELKEQNSSLEKFYQNAKRIYGRKLMESIGSELDGMRRQAIIEMVVMDRGMDASKVKWTPDMDSLISMQEACVLFDELSESILNFTTPDFVKVPQPESLSE